MSETIERLDYTKAPPGYNIVSDVDGYLFRDKGGNMYRSAGHQVGALIEAHARDKAAQGRYADS